MINKGMMSSNTNEWGTPQDLFDELNKEFGFTLDPCSTHQNAKCAKHYTAEDDGLSKDWSNDVVFCNPPYGTDIGNWVKKAYEENQKGATVVLLIPARTDTKYFHEYIYKKHEIRFLKGRLKFTNSEGKTQAAAPFPSMVVVMKGEFDYLVRQCYSDDIVFKTNDRKEAIDFILRAEGTEYSRHLDYVQRCVDNFEDPTIDERPAPYYETYFIIHNGGYYDITNIYRLGEKESE